jgi:hypothetical protein
MYGKIDYNKTSHLEKNIISHYRPHKKELEIAV